VIITPSDITDFVPVPPKIRIYMWPSLITRWWKPQDC
jgi:hypothetical protein